jgi:orotidine-5'-phosphate decarboxylase
VKPVKSVDRKQQLIIALDFDSPAKALDVVEQLKSIAGMFKVGSRLFTAGGPQIVKDILALDAKVFLDLKYHDIPYQIAGAARSAAKLGVSLFTIHASGGSEMMRRAVEAVAEVNNGHTKVLAITVLTSMDATTLSQIGVTLTLEESVLRLTNLAITSGVDGVVASPREIESIRRAVSNPEFIILTPGIRPATSQSEDQKRIATPTAAIAAGANYIVVGRPITGAADPLEAARGIVTEMERARIL